MGWAVIILLLAIIVLLVMYVNIRSKRIKSSR
jgi:hypothetical protein